MEWTGLNDLREQFLSFYESKMHTRLKSFPLVPQGDNSLLLINSGMAPLKKYFLGAVTPPNKRVTTCQKCIRTPDIERVGKTARHGTFFEMLGNFSFGDYFKHEATKWAWEFVTKVVKLPEDRVYITIYESDDEAFDIWTKEVGIPAERIVRMGKEDNFWEIGSGPCGPCSELYFDRGEKYGCGSPDCGVGCECDRFIEFWNLVFTQFNSDGEGNYTPLEHPNIDTGMGLERLACIMQGVDNLFEVDTVQNIMKHICQIANVEYHKNDKVDVSLRVITDHIRSTVFMVGDGVIPSNEGRGYVLRRLLRRAARHGRLLGITEPFLFKVCETVIKENLLSYPELSENKDYIQKVIESEEERFSKTIDQGIDQLDKLIAELQKDNKKVLSGDDAFKLYDTFGFPIDLTMEILEEKGLTVDEETFAKLMNEQRERAREARANLETISWEDDVLSDLKEKEQGFCGYEKTENETKVLAIVSANKRVNEIVEGEMATIILEDTCFYAESGGQVSDTGIIKTANGEFKVTNCQKAPSGLFRHIGEVVSGKISVSEAVTAKINEVKRLATTRNHSSCHLLQEALRRVLGNHVHQAGSFYDENRCRFDFSHFSAVTPEELQKVEDMVNEIILKGLNVDCTEMPLEEAKKLGAMALFGEKYKDIVRVVNMGDESIEFCGGCHVKNTANIGLFKIISEASVAAGVRRIEATTGFGVIKLLDEANDIIANTAKTIKASSPNELDAKAKSMVTEIKDLQKTIDILNAKLASIKSESLFENAVKVGDLRLITSDAQGMDTNALRALGDKLKSENDDIVAVLYAKGDKKISVLVVCGKDAVAKGVKAGDVIKEIGKLCGGSGGGRPDSAMGGCSDIAALKKALESTENIVAGMIK